MYRCKSSGRSLVMYVNGIEVWCNLRQIYRLELSLEDLLKLQGFLRDPAKRKEILSFDEGRQLVGFMSQ